MGGAGNCRSRGLPTSCGGSESSTTSTRATRRIKGPRLADFRAMEVGLHQDRLTHRLIAGAEDARTNPRWLTRIPAYSLPP